MIEKEQVDEFLPCKLSEKELLQAARELAANTQDMDALENRKKRVNDDIKAEVSKLEAEISVNSRKISTGEEYRLVPCEWKKDFTVGVKRLRRLDTDEVIKEKNIEQHERQTYLLAKEEGKKGAPTHAPSIQ